MILTSHERVMRIFRGEDVDRPALKLWGADITGPQLHPAYAPVSALAAETSDLFVSVSPAFNIYCGQNTKSCVQIEEIPTADPLWVDRHTTFLTPLGNLHEIERISTVGEPSYIMEFMIKEPEDIQALLSMPYEAFPFDERVFFDKERQVGDRGVAMLGLDHPGYALQRLIGSENLAFFSVDCREELHRAMAVLAARVRAFANEAIDHGIRGPFNWVGPELFIPPLLSPTDFEDFVFKYDAPLCADIHAAGGHTWVHCHGKVAGFIERYIAMGIDVLNPLEPPKNGDIFMEDTAKKFAGRIGLEGNIEIQDIIQAEPEHLKELISACITAGNQSGRFILCPSAGYMEYPFPDARYIENLQLYLRYGLECVEKCRKQ